jgi:hypothetical protein
MIYHVSCFQLEAPLSTQRLDQLKQRADAVPLDNDLRFSRQQFHRHNPLPGKRMSFRECNNKGIGQNQLVVHCTRRIRRSGKKSHIDTAFSEFSECRRSRHRMKLDRYIGVSGAKRLKDIRKNGRKFRPWYESDLKVTNVSVCCSLSMLNSELGTRKNGSALAEQGFSGVGQQHLSLCSFQKFETELLLQPVDHLTERGLAHVQPGRSSREMELLGNRQEISQMFEIHGVFISSQYYS